MIKNKPQWLNAKLWQRLLNNCEIAGRPMSDDVQKAAIVKLRKIVKTGQSQEKILLDAINGVYRGLDKAASEEKVPKQIENTTKSPALPQKPKNLNVINKNISEMRHYLR